MVNVFLPIYSICCATNGLIVALKERQQLLSLFAFSKHEYPPASLIYQSCKVIYIYARSINARVFVNNLNRLRCDKQYDSLLFLIAIVRGNWPKQIHEIPLQFIFISQWGFCLHSHVKPRALDNLFKTNFNMLFNDNQISCCKSKLQWWTRLKYAE